MRTVAAIGGGYGIAALTALALSLCLPWSPAENVTAGILAGLLVWPAMVMLCFALRTLLQVCMAIACGAALPAALALLGGWRP
ncbi:iron transporter [Gluconacetobacter takamatsuzukensis]|uniref:Iron transporter n=1 Tax=Gluconacetobacter takamatsuzukensis TaxID=1286190 RepID=A0A7W4KG59_9PROT|nr:iron transporter [Gluconacetobacter takamatsuzukensis]MBB2206283.1 iron transporter [Gluconacetobacter takamatsuzukensis]